MAPHSSTLAWKIPWMEEPGRLQSMGSLRAGHDWVTSLSWTGEGNGNPLQCSCLENPRDGGAWWAAIYGVAQSQTRLKRLSSSSTVNLVPQGSRLSQYFQVKILMECSDQVNFLFLKNPSEYFYYEYVAIYHQTLILTVLFFLTVNQVHNNTYGLSIDTNIQKFRNSCI